MGKTKLVIKLEDGTKIEEMVTDELLAYLSKEYQYTVGYEKTSFTFEKFVVQQLELRKEKAKGVYKNNGK